MLGQITDERGNVLGENSRCGGPFSSSNPKCWSEQLWRRGKFFTATSTTHCFFYDYRYSVGSFDSPKHNRINQAGFSSAKRILGKCFGIPQWSTNRGYVIQVLSI